MYFFKAFKYVLYTIALYSSKRLIGTTAVYECAIPWL